MTIFQIIEYIEQKGSRKARIIEMLKQYSVETASTWVGEQMYSWRNIEENRLRRTEFWARVMQDKLTNWWAPFGVSISDSLYRLKSWAYRTAWGFPRVVVGDPEGEYRPVSHTESPRDMCNVPNTQRIEIGEETENNETEFDCSEIDIF